MFKEMRRKDRLLDREEAQAILDKAEYGFLSTVNADGSPYCIPVNHVAHGGKIYFHCARGAGQKLENIARDPRVCFTAVGGTEVLPDQFGTLYESVVVHGRAYEADDGEKLDALQQILRKYSAGFYEEGLRYIDSMAQRTAIYAIVPEHMTGKARKR